MAPRFYVWQSFCNNLPADAFPSPQNLVEKLDASSKEVFTPFETLISSSIPLTKDFFIKFIKKFVKSTQA